MSNQDQSKDIPLAEQLARLVQAMTAAGRAILPSSTDALLRSIVEAASSIFGAGAASILLIDEDESSLVFRVATGASDRDLVGTRIPLNQGIAGYVAMTGQPIAISNVEHDARFNSTFAKSTGYVPKSILATPLLARDRVLGVMEVLDKINSPSFGMQDMELLGMFARQAALAIDQAQNIQRLDQALLFSLKRLAQSESGQDMGELVAALETAPDAEVENDLVRLAELLNQFGSLGESERNTCLQVLEAFAGYAQTQRRLIRGARR